MKGLERLGGCRPLNTKTGLILALSSTRKSFSICELRQSGLPPSAVTRGSAVMGEEKSVWRYRLRSIPRRVSFNALSGRVCSRLLERRYPVIAYLASTSHFTED